MSSYDKPSIVISVITDVKNSIRQVDIAKWLNFELSSSMLYYRAFLAYNPDYPMRTDNIMSFGDYQSE